MVRASICELSNGSGISDVDVNGAGDVVPVLVARLLAESVMPEVE